MNEFGPSSQIPLNPLSRNLMNTTPDQNGAGNASAWDDKETFIRKTFDDDPEKGCELLFRQYYQPMCSHAVRFVYSKEIAQDIVGEIFYIFLKRQLYLHIRSSFRAYLFIAVRNLSLKYLRKEFGKIDHTIDLHDIDHLSTDLTPQQMMQFHELNLKIDRTIQNLPPQCQRVFLMNRFEGRKYQDIANELKLSVKTVEAHISKALDVLRKAVNGETLIGLLIIFFL